MRLARITQPPEWGAAYYHAMSQTLPGTPPLTATDKEQFVAIIRRNEEFSQIKIVTYCVMDDHFHLLLQVPPRPILPPGDAELLAHAQSCTSPAAFELIKKEIANARKSGSDTRIHTARERILGRMWNLGEFFSLFKQSFTHWYNGQNGRRGQLWDGRIKTLLVEPAPIPLATIAAWIDLNPVRAKKATLSARYPWCGYAQAIAGEPRAVSGLSIITRALGAQSEKPSELFEHYDPWLAIENHSPSFIATSKKPDPAHLNRGRLLRSPLRHFLHGGVLGSETYVNAIIAELRAKDQPIKKGGAVRIPGDWDNLYALREVRRKSPHPQPPHDARQRRPRPA